MVEIAAIYKSLPEEFSHDADHRKSEWRRSIEDTLWSYLKGMETDSLPAAKCRAACYEGHAAAGPIQDRLSVREGSVSVKFTAETKRRKSFKEVCAEHSLLSKSRHSNTSDSTA